MSYIKDKEWNKAKTVAKRSGLGSNWVEIVDYYHSIGGVGAIVQTIIDGRSYQIICVTDQNSVLCVNADRQPVLFTYDMVLTSKKLFYYNSGEPTEVTIDVPGMHTVNQARTYTRMM